MSPDNTTGMPIVFVHGLWLHAESWNEWMEFFRQNGYDTVAASWPGDAETTEATRRNADAVTAGGGSWPNTA
jgi:non-heme chloroperoxidase